MTSVLYLTCNGLLEPLGQSQIIAYLRSLSGDYAITLYTHEKPEDLADNAALERARADCMRHGIRWEMRRFRRKPKLIATVMRLLAMFLFALREVRAGRVGLIHARSYLPAAVAWAVWRLRGTPFIFDMRALWPEELITAGRLRRGSLLHRVIAMIERLCLRDAAAVVSLTHAAVAYLRTVYPAELSSQQIAVIPTCADLDRFSPPPDGPPVGPMVHGCIGTLLSGWFRIDWLAAWIATVAECDPAARFSIISRDDPARIRTALDPQGLLGDRLEIGSRRPEEIPDAVRQHHLSVMFYAGGAVSELGRSPTRLAEVLGTGLPVVANEGVGDVARIVRDNRVGVVLDDPSPEAVRRALDELKALMADSDLSARCRRTAEELFSLEVGTVAYDRLYRRIFRTEGT
ncbi:hypothetical protein NIES2134_105250 [Thermostichus vulcanus NIES-2134]|nr:hypothetical protein NIES2134_105250 [Thermostichus vulcanus NIES-2134]